ncbi:MAG: hypothetical protein K8U57_07245 [Planctomycetes bacterium]|nr:hypothetical protein [Planctomycetota bacterium]
MRRTFSTRRLSRDDVQRRLMGWLGHAAQADTLPLVSRLASGWKLRRNQFVSFR